MQETEMTCLIPKQTMRDVVGRGGMWTSTLTLCGPKLGFLVCPAEPQRAQLLDQFAVWINEGGAGNEPSR
mgnify:CR=1 FL=1